MARQLAAWGKKREVEIWGYWSWYSYVIGFWIDTGLTRQIVRFHFLMLGATLSWILPKEKQYSYEEWLVWWNKKQKKKKAESPSALVDVVIVQSPEEKEEEERST